MQTINTQFEHELRALIDEDIERLRNNICTGSAKDLADYRYQCGQITALQRVEEFFTDVNTALSKR